MMADHYNRRRALLIVLGGEDSSAESSHSQSGKVASAYIFGTQRTGSVLLTFTTNSELILSCLKRGCLFELGRFCCQALIKGIGKHPPAILWAAFHAAVVAVTDAVELSRIGNRK